MKVRVKWKEAISNTVKKQGHGVELLAVAHFSPMELNQWRSPVWPHHLMNYVRVLSKAARADYFPISGPGRKTRERFPVVRDGPKRRQLLQLVEHLGGNIRFIKVASGRK